MVQRFKLKSFSQLQSLSELNNFHLISLTNKLLSAIIYFPSVKVVLIRTILVPNMTLSSILGSIL